MRSEMRPWLLMQSFAIDFDIVLPDMFAFTGGDDAGIRVIRKLSSKRHLVGLTISA